VRRDRRARRGLTGREDAKSGCEEALHRAHLTGIAGHRQDRQASPSTSGHRQHDGIANALPAAGEAKQRIDDEAIRGLAGARTSGWAAGGFAVNVAAMSPRSQLAALSALLGALAPAACSAPARPAATTPIGAQDPAPTPAAPAPAAPPPIERSETGGRAPRGIERSETGGGDPDGSAGGAGGRAPRGIDLALAARYFAEADQTCRAEAGRLWGESLCGAMLLVDSASRFAVANQPDAEAALTARDQVYVGTLPAGASMANTAFEWSGVRWSEIVWPGIPDDPLARRILFLHESFHRVQPRLGPQIFETDNDHLASADGRRLLRLEWRALAAALAGTGTVRTRAVADALAFRAARRRQFPAAAAAERALEANEGLAEYTARRIAGATDDERRELARANLIATEAKPSYVRSFAYGSGPAYGMLLDQAGADWHRRALAGDDLGDLLARALRVAPPTAADEVRRREAAYGGDAVRREETEREAARQQRVAELRAHLIDGPTLVLPAVKLRINFNPNELEPLGDAGTAYPTLRASAAWGELVVASGGALLAPDWSKVIVPAPSDPAGRPLRGEGWELQLAPGWSIDRGPRTGDWVLRGPP
jgi:hypothetical protein